MININEKKVKEVMEYIHKAVLRKKNRETNLKKDIVIENHLFALLCHNMYLHPREYAAALKEQYGYELTGNDVINIFRNRNVSNQNERKELLQWAEEIAEYFSESILGKKDSFEKFEKRRNETMKNGKKHKSQERIAAIMIFEKYPQIDIFDDKKHLYTLGDTFAKYFFFDISDAICDVYGFERYKKSTQKKAIENKISYEKAIEKIEHLENILDRTNAMFQDLQDDFSEQLQECKIEELTNFFAKLNSEKYGYILDELMAVRKGVNELRRNNYKLPVEINGLLVMVKNLIQFIKDSHIEPIMKIGIVKEVTASDIESCSYEGTPFKNNNETKKVKVISAGWMYKDKDLQIARPKVKEEK